MGNELIKTGTPERAEKGQSQSPHADRGQVIEEQLVFPTESVYTDSPLGNHFGEEFEIASLKGFEV